MSDIIDISPEDYQVVEPSTTSQDAVVEPSMTREELDAILAQPDPNQPDLDAILARLNAGECIIHPAPEAQ